MSAQPGEGAIAPWLDKGRWEWKGLAMANEWENRLRGAAAQVEAEVERVVKYLNDEVVPDVRKNGSEALRMAAQELQRLAERMDDSKTPPPPPPPPR